MKTDPLQHLKACARRYAAMRLADVEISPDGSWKFYAELERSETELQQAAIDFAAWVVGAPREKP